MRRRSHTVEMAIFALGLFTGAALDGDIALTLGGWRGFHLDLW